MKKARLISRVGKYIDSNILKGAASLLQKVNGNVLNCNVFCLRVSFVIPEEERLWLSTESSNY